MFYCGLDVAMKSSDVYITDSQGLKKVSGEVATEKAALTQRLRPYLRGGLAVALEAGNQSAWLHDLLVELGAQVTVVNPAKVKLIAESRQKTDKIDAKILCELLRLNGLPHPVHVPPAETRALRGLLVARRQLVTARVKLANVARGLLRQEGIRLECGALRVFIDWERLLEREFAHSHLKPMLAAYLESFKALTHSIQALDKQLAERERLDARAARLKTFPKVGRIAALTFLAAVDQVERFSTSRKLVGYSGLAPTVRSSGDRTHYGAISRQGRAELRGVWVQIAHLVAMDTGKATAPLRKWFSKVAYHRGKKTAIVALARKLLTIAYRLLRDETVYDAANRLLEIRHEDGAAGVLHKTTYAWNVDNTVAVRTEIDNVVDPPTMHIVTFAYDQRGRLIRETRERVAGRTTVYDMGYEYDPLGNRTAKIDRRVEGTYTIYYYDSVEANRDPDYQTNNNRLLKYEDYVEDERVRTVQYTYYKTGHVSNITVIDAGQAWRNDMAFYYTSNGQLWQVLWDRWKVDENGDATDYERLKAREFRYDTPRARYMSRVVDKDSFGPMALAEWEWTDYDGDEAYGDFAVGLDGAGEPGATEVMRYAGGGSGGGSGGGLGGAGFGPFARQAVGVGIPPADVTTYMFGDLVRSMVMATDEAGEPLATTAYTAFGEVVGGSSALEGRYSGYAGGWGYESGLLTLEGANDDLPAITLQHVGARWYQPGIGRFVQRDPIGLGGGVNAYSYVMSRPDSLVDALGTSSNPTADGFREAARVVKEIADIGHETAVVLLVGFSWWCPHGHLATDLLPKS